MTADSHAVEAQRRRFRRDIAWNLVPVLLLGVVGLGLKLLIGGWWGASALGVFNLVTTAYFAIAVLGAGGLQFAVLRAVAEDPDDRDRVAAVVVGALVPTIGFAALAAGLFVAIRGPVSDLLDSPGVAVGMLWAAPGLFCFAVNKVLLGVVNGLHRMRAFAVYTSLRYLLIAGGLVLARVTELDGDQLALIWTFSEGVLLLVLVGELLSTVQLARGRGWLAWAGRHIDYGARGVVSTLAYEINSKLDVWMLGIAMSDAQVGIYSVASALFEGAMQLGVVVQNNLNPVMARHLAAGRGEEVEAIARRSRRWFVPALVAACAIGAAVYPQLIPWLIDDAAFAAGSIPFAILMAGVALASAYLPFTQLLLMAQHPGWHTLYILAVVAIALICNVLLIPPLGLVGAALSTATGTVMSAVLLRSLVRWRVGLRI